MSAQVHMLAPSASRARCEDATKKGWRFLHGMANVFYECLEDIISSRKLQLLVEGATSAWDIFFRCSLHGSLLSVSTCHSAKAKLHPAVQI